jgi:spore maturation protein SpmB
MGNEIPDIPTRLRTGFSGGLRTALKIVKITFPLYVAVDLLKTATPAVDALGRLFAPAMELFGLPGAAAFAFVAAGLLNIYAGLAIISPLGLDPFQVTQCGLMMGVAHNLLLEGGVLGSTGTRGTLLTLLRILIAVVVGVGLNAARLAGLVELGGKAVAVALPAAPAAVRLPFAEALPGSLLGACRLSGKLTLIVVPLVAAFELLRHMPVFRKAGRAVDPAMRGMGLTADAAVPLFTGIFLGIAYGAGIIIRVAQEKGLPKRDLFLMGLFLATCHAVVEDTLVFGAIGGSMTLILGIRTVLAFALTAALGRIWKRAA